jgi:hypothetical protein
MIASLPPGLREPSGHILGTSMLLLGQPGKWGFGLSRHCR